MNIVMLAPCQGVIHESGMLAACQGVMNESGNVSTIPGSNVRI